MIESAYDKVVNNAWQIIESSLEEEKMEDEYFDDPRVYDLIRLCLLRAWIDYLKEDHFDEGVIESLEKSLSQFVRRIQVFLLLIERCLMLKLCGLFKNFG